MKRGSSFSGNNNSSKHTHLGVASPNAPGATSLWVGSNESSPSLGQNTNGYGEEGYDEGRHELGRHEFGADRGIHQQTSHSQGVQMNHSPERKTGHSFVVVSVRDSASEYKAGRRRSDAGITEKPAPIVASVRGSKHAPSSSSTSRPASGTNLGRSSSSAARFASPSVPVVRAKVGHNHPSSRVGGVTDSTDGGNRLTSPVEGRRNEGLARANSNIVRNSSLTNSNLVRTGSLANSNLGRTGSLANNNLGRTSNLAGKNDVRMSDVRRSDVSRKSNVSRTSSLGPQGYGTTPSTSEMFQTPFQHNNPSYLTPVGYGSSMTNTGNTSYLLGGSNVGNSNLSLLAGNTSNLLGGLNGSTSSLYGSGPALYNPYGVSPAYNGVTFYPAAASSMTSLPQDVGVGGGYGNNNNNYLKQQLTDPEYLAKSLQETLNLTGSYNAGTPMQTPLGSNLDVSNSVGNFQSVASFQPVQNAPPVFVGQNVGVGLSGFQNLSPLDQQRLLNSGVSPTAYQSVSLADQQRLRELSSAMAVASQPQTGVYSSQTAGAYSPLQGQHVYGQKDQHGPYLGHTFEVLSAAVAAGQVKSPSSSSAASSSSPPPFSPSGLDPHHLPPTLSGFSSSPDHHHGRVNGFKDVRSPPPVPPKFTSSPRGDLLSEGSNNNTLPMFKKDSSGVQQQAYTDGPHFNRTSSMERYGDEGTSGLGSSLPSSPSDWSPTSPRNDLRVSDEGQGQGQGQPVTLVEPVYERPRDRDACMKCGKKVYAMEKLGPVKDVLYHKACFSCRACNISLNLKNFHNNDEDLADLGVYCVTHKPSVRATSLDSRAVGIHRALTVPKHEIVNDQIRGGAEAGRNTHVDCNAVNIRSALHTPAPSLQSSIKPREDAWYREQRKYAPVPPRDVVRSNSLKYEGSRSLYAEEKS